MRTRTDRFVVPGTPLVSTVESEGERGVIFCPSGKSVQSDKLPCPAPFAKIFRFPRRANHLYKLAPSRPDTRGVAHVINAGRDAVDADGAKDERT